MTEQPTRDQLLDMTEGLRVLGDRPELCDEVVDGLWAALAAAEHRATRAEAQSDARRINAEYWKALARDAEARIGAVRDVLDHWRLDDLDLLVPAADIRRALDD